MEPTPEQLAAEDAPYWAKVNKVLIDGSPFELEGRKYQLEMMRPVTADGKFKHFEVIRKGSQIGVTIIMVIEISHGALHGIYPKGIIYYFPSGKAVEHFSAGRFKPFLKDNYSVVGKHCNDINAVGLRRIGKTNVNFMGGSATTIIKGEAKDSVSLRSTPADWVLLDERDLFDDEMASQVNQRLGDSRIRRRSDIGTPKLPDDGIDLLYKKSDMRRWQIECDSCKKHTCLETEFPNIIKINSDGVGYPACVHCDRPIRRGNGAWVPDSPEKDTVGYWCSQLLNPNRDLALVLKEFDDPEAYGMSIAECWRTTMGMPYASPEDRLSESEVYACCSPEQMSYSHPGPCAMGVDIGKTIHAVVGHRIGKDRYRLIKMARLPDFGALHDLAGRFNVKSCVVDAQPEYHKAREIQKSEPYAVYLCYYSEHLKMSDSWNLVDNIVKVNTVDIFDESHQMITQPGRLLIPRNCEEVKIFAHQMTMRAKFIETDRYGEKIYRYKKIGDKEDHYRNALNYFYLACKKVGVPQTESKKRKVVTQDMSFKLGARKCDSNLQRTI
jgi:hypothetical protein